MKLRLLSLLLLAYSTTSFALFCPKNFNLIDIGNTMDQVEIKCGKPDSEKTTEMGPSGPQEWNYYLKMNPTDEGTIKVAFVFDSNEKIINMSSNGIGVGSTAICGKNLDLSSTMKEVKAACGEPTFINQPSSTSGNQPPKKKVTEWTYNSTPPVTLIFEDGQFTGKK